MSQKTKATKEMFHNAQLKISETANEASETTKEFVNSAQTKVSQSIDDAKLFVHEAS